MKLHKPNHRIRALLEALLQHVEQDNLQYNRNRHFDPHVGRTLDEITPGRHYEGGDKLTRYVGEEPKAP